MQTDRCIWRAQRARCGGKTRMQAWQVPEIKPGTAVSVVGFGLRDEKGEAVLRAEYLFVDGKAYGLRSSPA